MRVVVVAALTFGIGAISGCGPDYGADNSDLADRLFAASSSLEVIGSEEATYCSKDSCPFSDDRVVTTYQVRVVESTDDVVAGFHAAYPEFAIFEDDCAEVGCEGLFQVSASDEDRLVFLNIAENMIGTLTVDAQVPDQPVSTAG